MAERLEYSYLKQKQSLPLEAKVVLAQQRIREFYDQTEGNVYIAFSGGKDSTVVLDLVRGIYPNVPAVFHNTGVEHPESVQFVRKFDNVIWRRPKLSFIEIVDKYGYPVISKNIARAVGVCQKPNENNVNLRRFYLEGIRKDGTRTNKAPTISQKWRFLIDAPFKISEACCYHLKKTTANKFTKETGRYAYVGLMAADSWTRRGAYLQRGGCNYFGSETTSSWPLGVWTEEDVWEYIRTRNLEYCPVYDMGEDRTGCTFCLFGIHIDSERGENRIQRMAKRHPKIWKYYMENTEMKLVMDYLKYPYEPVD